MRVLVVEEVPGDGAAAAAALAAAGHEVAGCHDGGSPLLVVLRPGVELDPHVAETASVRVLAAVRAFDPRAAVIDVTIAA